MSHTAVTGKFYPSALDLSAKSEIDVFYAIFICTHGIYCKINTRAFLQTKTPDKNFFIWSYRDTTDLTNDEHIKYL